MGYGTEIILGWQQPEWLEKVAPYMEIPKDFHDFEYNPIPLRWAWWDFMCSMGLQYESTDWRNGSSRCALSQTWSGVSPPCKFDEYNVANVKLSKKLPGLAEFYPWIISCHNDGEMGEELVDTSIGIVFTGRYTRSMINWGLPNRWNSTILNEQSIGRMTLAKEIICRYLPWFKSAAFIAKTVFY